MVRKIVLSLAAVLTMCFAASAQNRQITGTVTGEDGRPIAGATVVVDGTTIGTNTDAHGRYTLSAPENGTLIVSFLGYKDETVAINGMTEINVALNEHVESLDDVIVIAFGEAKKEAFTGSAKVISSDDLIKTQSSSVSDALVGKVAGVQFTSTSGRLGAGQNINVRGLGSLSAENKPLWIVDGVPYGGDINNINTADIESVSILKDAASNALYGARGANGVIMITTKRAKMGDAKVTFDGKWGMNNKALQSYDLTETAGEYYEMHYKALYNNYRLNRGYSNQEAYMAANTALVGPATGGGVGYNVMTYPAGQNLIGENGRLNPLATEGRLVTDSKGNQFYLQPDNWLDALYKNSFRQEYNVSVSAATEKSNFYASFGYLDNDGIIDGSSMERYTARLRADYQAKKWLKVGANMSYTNFTWNNGNSADSEGASDGGNAFATAYQIAPVYPLYIRDANGNIMVDSNGLQIYDIGDGANGGALRTNGGTSNDLQDIQLNKYISEGNAFSVNGFADFLLYKGLKLTINGSTTVDETRGTTLLNPYYGQFATSGGVVSKSHSRTWEYNLQQLLNYNNTFGEHTIDVLLGHEMYSLKSYYVGASKSGMFSYDNDELDALITDGSKATSYITQYNNEGYFFRAQYDYAEKVFVSASYRRDASSKFHPDHRWGNFWSVGAAWLINREGWFNAPWVDLLKIKASYGSQGNDNISPYLYTDLYSISNDGNGNISTIFARKGNENITWETNANLNVGVEFGFWGNRLTGSVDFFDRTTTDMLFELPVPSSLGYSSIWTNIGDMNNRGVEIDLAADLIRSKNVLWSFNLNMTHYRNKLVRLPDDYKQNEIDGHWGYISSSYFHGEGLPFYTFYMPTYAGVSDNGESMWYTYNDQGERVTTTSYSEASANGKELQGDSTPDLYGGFGTSLNLYGVDLSISFTYQIGGLVYDSGYAYFMNSPMGTSTGFNYHRDLANAWTPENLNSDIPRFVYGDQYTNATSSRFLTDASYLNIQNITLGYTLPQHITRKFYVDRLRIYLACDNVWYWSRRQGLDPRQGITGGSNPFYYAPIRTISGGVTITF